VTKHNTELIWIDQFVGFVGNGDWKVKKWLKTP